MNKESYNVRQGKIGTCKVEFVSPGTVVNIGDLSITHFSTKHDTVMSFGYNVKQGDSTFVYVTDTGMITPSMAEHIKQANLLMIEADYDQQLLDDYEGYDDWLKSRIMSNVGHLSNEQAISFIKKLDLDKLKNIIFAHLSPRTNTPETIIKLAHEAFPDNKEKFLVAPLSNAVEC